MRNYLEIFRFDEMGIIQAPPSVSKGNYAPLTESIICQPQKLPEQEWKNAQVTQTIQRHTEPEWVTHMMSQMLPDQGTNSRALIFKRLRMMDDPRLVPADFCKNKTRVSAEPRSQLYPNHYFYSLFCAENLQNFTQKYRDPDFYSHFRNRVFAKVGRKKNINVQFFCPHTIFTGV